MVCFARSGPTRSISGIYHTLGTRMRYCEQIYIVDVVTQLRLYQES